MQYVPPAPVHTRVSIDLNVVNGSPQPRVHMMGHEVPVRMVSPGVYEVNSPDGVVGDMVSFRVEQT